VGWEMDERWFGEGGGGEKPLKIEIDWKVVGRLLERSCA